jgi:hypothetical protein
VTPGLFVDCCCSSHWSQLTFPSGNRVVSASARPLLMGPASTRRLLAHRRPRRADRKRAAQDRRVPAQRLERPQARSGSHQVSGHRRSRRLAAREVLASHGIMGGMTGRPAAAAGAARPSPRFRGRADEAGGHGDHTGGEPATGPARTGRDAERDHREAADGPIVVDETIVAGRVRQRVPAFLVALAPALALTVVFARVFAAVFQTPVPRAPQASAAARPLDHTRPRAPHQPGCCTAAR